MSKWIINGVHIYTGENLHRKSFKCYIICKPIKTINNCDRFSAHQALIYFVDRSCGPELYKIKINHIRNYLPLIRNLNVSQKLPIQCHCKIFEFEYLSHPWMNPFHIAQMFSLTFIVQVCTFPVSAKEGTF